VQLEVISHQPRGLARATPIVLVHGSWHGAWCWERFQPYLAEHGYASHAVSLRGHGGSEGRERLRWASAVRHYADDVARVAAGLGAPPILVGHSMGGYIVQKYLETHTAAGAVLLASIPVSGIWRFALRVLRRHPWAFLKAHLTLSPWHIVGTPALARDAFFSPGTTPEDLERHFRRLGPESFRMELEALVLALPRPRRVETPVLVLAGEGDRIFSVAEQRATARAYRTEAEVFPGMAHDMMLEPGWRAVADRILRWADAREAESARPAARAG
jgi:pimeloyl-ACP methyl ester carboxylesterase